MWAEDKFDEEKEKEGEEKEEDGGDEDDDDEDEDNVGSSFSLLWGNINTQLAKQLRTGCHVAGELLEIGWWIFF